MPSPDHDTDVTPAHQYLLSTGITEQELDRLPFTDLVALYVQAEQELALLVSATVPPP